MRVLIGNTLAYAVDRFCPTARDGKRVLKENDVYTLYIDHRLVGRETGTDALRWSLEHDLTPQHVVLVTTNRNQRVAMGYLLEASGYRSADGINYRRWQGR
ncbi:hypothetical protein FKG94_11965 [Exilibacterium tricleocarpae]|uniref:Cyclic-phosphate processing Receiver domain-containing protein n=1 Tax=Exilibacterium tricleocarpae TaxID=2591008 RepID=A0A545TND2_9GAMM|nr:cyclic-phosphate processing receiver domain-containing protein [Exilibacterium tricleocarpae]TQV78733.1 hypothetical protein FKG94_11965 [Exilibacterium tricleocarpae]